MRKIPKQEICSRIAKLRTEVCGPRGKSAFAQKLGLSPSTYDYYESKRVPPADVLVAIADLAGVDLRWLITGESAAGEATHGDNPVIRRAAALLAEHPDAAAALGAFLDILSESSRFPAKPAATRRQASGPRDSWLPVLGRSAAGVPQFWTDAAQAQSVTQLGELIDRHARQAERHARPAIAQHRDSDRRAVVQILTLRRAEKGTADEFVAAEDIKARWPDAFAVRIDGESMSPDIRHGDLVVLSPSAPAADGRAAVVQLVDQIGVTCKLYRRSGPNVHLVPINEQFAPQSVPGESVVWALRVLARIRPQ